MKNNNTQNLHNTISQEHEQTKRDLVKILILNAVYLAGLLALYFTNKQTGYLDAWFAKIFRF